MADHKRRFPWLYVLSLLVILIYPLRNAGVGVDLWDGGYNYANFTYSGPGHMDPMWYFATWLSNLYGSFLIRLPFGDTMLGMNAWTSLTAGAVAAAAYVFCTRSLRIPAWMAFAGEMAALSLCWAPSAVLYHYLTYSLFLAGTLLLFQGLTKDKMWCLGLAGAALGLNVGVRFPNIVHAGLILAVWYYAFLSRKKISRVLRETGVCVLGYLGGCCLFLIPIALLYGLDSYAEGIGRLFAMTDDAADYAAGAMLAGLVKAYFDPETTYWLKRFALLLAGTLGICLLLPGRWERVKRAATGVLTLVFLLLIAKKGFCTGDYALYASIYMPCVFLLGAAIALSVFQLADRRADKQRKLLALFILLTLSLAALGSNNYIYSNINNLFLVLPCFFWLAGCFLREKRHIFYFPFQAVTAALILLLTVQALLFGRGFVYEEASGARDTGCRVTGIPVLEGMRTGSGRAQQLQSLYGYLQDAGLSGRECVLYGGIPGIAYYMELAPALNVWGDLRSYSCEAMKADMDRLARKCGSGGEFPLVILGGSWARYLEEPAEAADYWDQTAVDKLGLVREFMEAFSYGKAFDNGAFVVYSRGVFD